MGAIAGAVWKWFIGPIAGPVLGVLLLAGGIGFAVTWTVQRWEISRLNTELAGKKDEIDNASTGWVVRNARCETNFNTVSAGLKRVSGDVEQLAADTKANDDKLTTAMGKATAGLRGVQDSAAKLLAMPRTAPIGSMEACHAGAAILRGGVP